MIEFKCKHLMNIIFNQVRFHHTAKIKIIYDERKDDYKIIDRGKSVIMFLLILLIRISVFLIQLVPRLTKFIRQGNREYEKSRYSESEILYQKHWTK